ncbi:hypothetical protein GGI12_005835, partial [Dipsacomyces acuminosporus]
YLRITNISPDISWNWFDSGDGNDVWFSSLKNLQITFGPWIGNLTYYHRGDVSRLRLSSCYTDYREVTKRVHFPALEKLRIRPFTLWDDEFYSLFKDSPLKHVDIQSPQGSEHHIPAWMLATATSLRVHLAYEVSQFKTRNDGQHPVVSKIESYEEALLRLLSSPSAARSARISTLTSRALSLPSTWAWYSVENLRLDFCVSMQSIRAVLAQMPKLDSFSFHLQPQHQEGECNDEASTSRLQNQQQQQQVANSNVICIEVLNDVTKALSK